MLEGGRYGPSKPGWVSSERSREGSMTGDGSGARAGMGSGVRRTGCGATGTGVSRGSNRSAGTVRAAAIPVTSPASNGTPKPASVSAPFRPRAAARGRNGSTGTDRQRHRDRQEASQYERDDSQ